MDWWRWNESHTFTKKQMPASNEANEELWAFPLMNDAAFEEIEHLPGFGCASNWGSVHRELFARVNVLGCRTERGVTLRQEMIGMLRRNSRRTQACATEMLRHVGPKSQRTVPSEALDALETECPVWFSDLQAKLMFAYALWVSLAPSLSGKPHISPGWSQDDIPTHGWGDWRDFNSNLPRIVPMSTDTAVRTIVECSLTRNTIQLFCTKHSQIERSDDTARAMYREFKQYLWPRGHTVTGMRRVFDAVQGATMKTMPLLVLNDTVSLNASSSRAIDVFVNRELVGRICADGSAVFTSQQAGDIATILYDSVHDATKAREVLESAYSASRGHDAKLRVDVEMWLATPCAPVVGSVWDTNDPMDVIRCASGVMMVMAGHDRAPWIRTPRLQDHEDEWNEVKAFVRDQFDVGDLETLAEFLVRRGVLYGKESIREQYAVDSDHVTPTRLSGPVDGVSLSMLIGWVKREFQHVQAERLDEVNSLFKQLQADYIERRVQVADDASDAAKNAAAVQNKYAAFQAISDARVTRHHMRRVVKIAKAAGMHASKKEFAAFVWRRMLTPSMIRLVHFLDVQLAMRHMPPFLRAYRTRVLWETWADDTVFPPVPRRVEGVIEAGVECRKRKNRETNVELSSGPITLESFESWVLRL